ALFVSSEHLPAVRHAFHGTSVHAAECCLRVDGGRQLAAEPTVAAGKRWLCSRVRRLHAAIRGTRAVVCVGDGRVFSAAMETGGSAAAAFGDSLFAVAGARDAGAAK